MCSSIRKFCFKIPVLARSDGEVVDGHLRIKEARKLRMTEIPSTCRSPDSIPAKSTHCWSSPRMTSGQMRRHRCPRILYPVSATFGFVDRTGCCVVMRPTGKLLPACSATANHCCSLLILHTALNWIPNGATAPGLNGCGPAEPSYMKKRTQGHTETSISGDTRADWSEAFELVPSLQIAYAGTHRGSLARC